MYSRCALTTSMQYILIGITLFKSSYHNVLMSLTTLKWTQSWEKCYTNYTAHFNKGNSINYQCAHNFIIYLYNLIALHNVLLLVVSSLSAL
jgi:hypothetical protein